MPVDFPSSGPPVGRPDALNQAAIKQTKRVNEAISKGNITPTALEKLRSENARLKQTALGAIALLNQSNEAIKAAKLELSRNVDASARPRSTKTHRVAAQSAITTHRPRTAAGSPAAAAKPSIGSEAQMLQRHPSKPATPISAAPPGRAASAPARPVAAPVHLPAPPSKENALPIAPHRTLRDHQHTVPRPPSTPKPENPASRIPSPPAAPAAAAIAASAVAAGPIAQASPAQIRLESEADKALRIQREADEADEDVSMRYVMTEAVGGDLLTPDDTGYSLFALGCIMGHPEYAQKFVDAGKKDLLITQDVDGDTPLHLMCSYYSNEDNPHPDLFQPVPGRLPDKQAEVVKIFGKNLTLEQLSLRNSNDESVADLVCLEGLQRVAQALVDTGKIAVFAAQDNNGDTALHLLCKIPAADMTSQHIETARLLISKLTPAQLQIKNHSGESLLDLARQNGHAALVALITTGLS